MSPQTVTSPRHEEPLRGGRGRPHAWRAYIRRVRANPVARNSAYVIGSLLSLAFLQGLQFFLLARALGPIEFGHIAAVVAITAAIVPFSGMGLGNMAVLRIARRQAGAQASLGNALAMTTVTGSIGVGLAVALGAGFLHQPGTWLLMLLLGTSDILLTKYIDVAAHVFYGLEKHPFSLVFYNLHMVLRLACAAALWAGIGEPTALGWAQLHLASGVATALIVLGVTLHQVGRPAGSLAVAMQDARPGFFFALSVASRSVQMDVDKSVLARSASSATAGVYTAAFRLVYMACMPIFAVAVAMQGRMYRTGHEHGMVGTLREIRVPLMLATGYCLLLALAIYFGAPAIPWLLGESYRGSIEIVHWLCLLPLFLTVHAIAAGAVSGADAQRPLGFVHCSAAAVALALNLWLVPAHGWGGAVAAAYGSNAFLLAGVAVLIGVRLRRTAKARA
jgi:O-antigen/teichoic acid export membrane protein